MYYVIGNKEVAALCSNHLFSYYLAQILVSASQDRKRGREKDAFLYNDDSLYLFMNFLTTYDFSVPRVLLAIERKQS